MRLGKYFFRGLLNFMENKKNMNEMFNGNAFQSSFNIP